MSAVGPVAILLVAVIASLFMAWTIGAGSSGSTPFAPAVGANAIPVMRAGFAVGILGFIGAALQGGSVSETIGSGLIYGVNISSVAVIIGLFTAAVLVAVGIFTGYPIATAFTVTGAMTGVGLALGGAPAWDTYALIATLWVLIPFVGGGIAYVTARVLATSRIPTEYSITILVLLTGIVVVNMPFSVLGANGESASLVMAIGTRIMPSTYLSHGSVAGLSVCLAGVVSYRIRGSHVRSPERTERRFLLSLGALVAFSAGATQVGLAVGPLLPLLDEWSFPLVWVLLLGGLGLLLGSWTGAPRMIKALSQDYSSLGPKRSIAALVPSFIIAQSAVFLGVPVSFNEIIVSAIIGSGYAAENSVVSFEKIRNTALAWIGSLLLSFVCSYGVLTALNQLS